MSPSVYMGKCEVVVGDVMRLLSVGVARSQSSRTLNASSILKVFGFSGDWEVDDLPPVKEMRGNWPSAGIRQFIASEGPGVNASEVALTQAPSRRSSRPHTSWTSPMTGR